MSQSAAFVSGLESLLGVDLINPKVYFIDYLPAELRLRDVLAVCVISLGLAVTATLYPALRAASLQPAAAVRRD